MRIDKIINVLAISFIITCCAEPENTVSREEYDDVVEEYNELKESMQLTQQAYVRQAEQIDSILVSISSVSGKTNSLRSDVEHGSYRMTQVQQIENNLVAIKAKLDALERQVKDNAEFRKVVADLKNIVVEKEKEIATLKKQIAAKDKKIKEQGEVIQEQSSKIETQMNTIMKQNLRLENEIKKQAQMLYEAGLAFESLGDDSPEIKRKKDKAKVENLTKQMYQNALEYYQQAFDSGYSAAEERISAVKRKMTYL